METAQAAALTQAAQAELAQAAQAKLAQAAQAKLASRLRVLEPIQQLEGEHARLAAHVAWIEGRLGHAEAEAAALRHQLSELQRRDVGLTQRALRAVHGARHRLAYPNLARQLRRPAAVLLQRLVRETLRRPALKRLARSVVLRIPGLHARLLRTMYAQPPASDIVPVEADPLTSQMSPRSLAIYRVLSAPTKQEH
jgi:hypothetical protein